MQQWEYQVIHLNVDSGGDKETPPPQAPPAQGVTPPFTKTYLEQEFPNHYGPHPAPAAGTPPQPPAHPAVQLQGFINSHGLNGWELLGIFPLGALLMMIFRRPLAPAAPAAEAASPASQASVSPEPAGSLPTPASAAAEDAMAVLTRRLEDLEARLASGTAAAGPAAPASRQAEARRSALRRNPSRPVPREGRDRILGEAQREALTGLHPRRCSTAEAASLLGFRSPASLLNSAGRLGYPLGLVRQGPNGLVAVYHGQEPSPRGGRETRLWLVLEAEHLPQGS